MKVERKIVHGYSEDQIICTWPNRNNILIVSCFCEFYTSQWEDRKPASAVHHAWKLVVYLLILDSYLWTWHDICLKRIEGKESKESGFTSDHYGGDESRLFYSGECSASHVLPYIYVLRCLWQMLMRWESCRFWCCRFIGNMNFGGLALWRWRHCIPLECTC
jgi:hypothetical protein